MNGRVEGAPLDCLVASILADHGLDGTGTRTLDGFLDGYVVDRPMSAREALEPLARLFGFDAVASGGGMRWVGRGGRIAAAVVAGDLVEEENAALLARVRAQETELPAAIELGFVDGDGEYGRAVVGSRRLTGGSRRLLSTEIAAVTGRANASALAERRLQDLWAGRETIEFTLSPRALAIEPGDVLALDGDARGELYRVTRIADGAARRVFARAVEPAVFTGGGSMAASPRRRAPPPVPGPAHVVTLDLPAAPGNPPTLQYIAAAADPWPGALAVWRSAGGGSFALHRVLDLPAVIGRTLGVFPSGPVWRWDRGASLDVELSGPGFSAVDDVAALGGANLLALQGPDAAWEILSAASAELIGPRRYRLRHFLRGLAGSENAAGRAAPAGATLVRLDDAIAALTNDPADLGQTWTYRVGPIGRDHADPSYVQFTATASPLALKPFAPVRVRAVREAAGVRIGWTRRTRIGGDAWEPLDVPLGEEVEGYEVDVLEGGAVKRTLTASAPEALYLAADELADFGAAQAMLSLRVAQMSRTVGRGFASEAIVPVG